MYILVYLSPSAIVCTSTKLNDNYRFNHLSFLILNLSSVVNKYSNVLFNNMFDQVFLSPLKLLYLEIYRQIPIAIRRLEGKVIIDYNEIKYQHLFSSYLP